MAKKIIDPAEILHRFEFLKDGTPFIATDSWLKGAEIFVEIGGNWKCTNVSQTKEFERGDITLTKGGREYKLRKPMFNFSSADGIEGVSLGVSFDDETPIKGGKCIHRRLIFLSKNQLRGILFPTQLLDKSRSLEVHELLDLKTKYGPLDIFRINGGSVLVLELITDSTVLKKTVDDALGLSLLFLSYIFGKSLDGDGIQMHLDEKTGRLISLIGFSGRKTPGADYAPIPSDHANWTRAKRQLKANLPARSLDPNTISKPLNRFLDEPDLLHVLEYLNFFPIAPVEMRGSLLSIALEALTDRLEKKGAVKFENPFGKEAWEQISAALLEELRKAASPETPETTFELFTAKFKNLNRPSNNDKLRKPFQVLGIELSPLEKKAVNERNKLLHSGRYYTKGEMDQADDAWVEPFLLEMSLYTAINKLLLKYLEYSGPIYDWGAKHPHSAEPKFSMI